MSNARKITLISLVRKYGGKLAHRFEGESTYAFPTQHSASDCFHAVTRSGLRNLGSYCVGQELTIYRY